MDHKWLRQFDEKGNWTGNKDRTIMIDGKWYDMDAHAQAHGIELPDAKKSKKSINIKEEKHADLDGKGDSSDTEKS